ncbi:MAG: tyrosine-protein phosphatase [Phycisphaeraceae bacterium]|nr:tyrosine-protein phosphatase [Phycisphaeraceae bacterium]
MVSPAPSKPARYFLLAVVVAALAAWAYLGKGGIRDHVVPRNFGVVEEGHVYRAAALTPTTLRQVHAEHGIKTIIDLGGFDVDPRGEALSQRTAESLGITRYVFPLSGDGTGNPNAYVAALRVLADERNHPVLVHCSAGAQRTSGCIVLYRDVIQLRDNAEARREAFGFRHDPRDNPRLFEYLDDWQEKIKRAFRAGVDAQVPGQQPVEVRPHTPPSNGGAESR